MTEYFRPRQLHEAFGLAAQSGITIAAGCTDLFPATQSQVLAGPVLDVTQINEMRGITKDSTGWRFGGASTWSDILRTDLPPAFDGLKQAAREVGSVQIQNAGTIAGNLCNASPAADGVPPLLVLDASVELASAKGTRQLLLQDFLIGPGQTALLPGEILSAVVTPAAEGQTAFLKLGARRYMVISIAMIAMRLCTSDGKVTKAAIAVGACSAVARRLAAQEQAMIGAPLSGLADCVDPALIEPNLAPITDIRADAAYRSGSATELVRRVTAQLAEKLAR